MNLDIFSDRLFKFSSRHSSLGDFICKVIVQEPAFGYLYGNGRFLLDGQRWIHSVPCISMVDKVVEPTNHSGNNAAVDGAGNDKVKRKKLKGKRAVVRWLKFFRWKKKKEYQRMTAEEKILYKLRKVSILVFRLVVVLFS